MSDSGATTPRVSVLMTIFNAARFLRRTLDSLSAQTFGDWELVAVENGSRDESPNILAAWGDSRLRAIDLAENIGRTPALQLGLQRARGKYVAVLDADDLSHPERLRREVEFLDANDGVTLVGTWTDLIDSDDKVVDHYRPPATHEELIDVLAGENPIVHSSAMYRRDVALDVGGYPKGLAHSQDMGLWLRLLKRGRLAVLQQSLCQYRIAPAGMTQSRRYRIDAALDHIQLFRTVRAELPLGPAARVRNREELALARARYAWSLAMNGRVFRAIGACVGAVVRDPVALFNNRVSREFLSR
jgi:GT2 family glycosyltransferase